MRGHGDAALAGDAKKKAAIEIAAFEILYLTYFLSFLIGEDQPQSVDDAADAQGKEQ